MSYSSYTSGRYLTPLSKKQPTRISLTKAQTNLFIGLLPRTPPTRTTYHFALSVLSVPPSFGSSNSKLGYLHSCFPGPLHISKLRIVFAAHVTLVPLTASPCPGDCSSRVPRGVDPVPAIKRPKNLNSRRFKRTRQRFYSTATKHENNKHEHGFCRITLTRPHSRARSRSPTPRRHGRFPLHPKTTLSPFPFPFPSLSSYLPPF